jgi:hypothetical protein
MYPLPQRLKRCAVGRAAGTYLHRNRNASITNTRALSPDVVCGLHACMYWTINPAPTFNQICLL